MRHQSPRWHFKNATIPDLENPSPQEILYKTQENCPTTRAVQTELTHLFNNYHNLNFNKKNKGKTLLQYSACLILWKKPHAAEIFERVLQEALRRKIDLNLEETVHVKDLNNRDMMVSLSIEDILTQSGNIKTLILFLKTTRRKLNARNVNNALLSFFPYLAENANDVRDSMSDYVAFLEKLLESQNTNSTLLQRAIENNAPIKIIECLLRQKNIDANQTTAIYIAMQKNNIRVAEALFDRGAILSIKDVYENFNININNMIVSFFHHLAQHEKNKKIRIRIVEKTLYAFKEIINEVAWAENIKKQISSGPVKDLLNDFIENKKNKIYSFLMGKHSLFGANSPVRDLPRDVIEMIVKKTLSQNEGRRLVP